MLASILHYSDWSSPYLSAQMAATLTVKFLNLVQFSHLNGYKPCWQASWLKVIRGLSRVRLSDQSYSEVQPWQSTIVGYDDDDSRSYVRRLLQLETVTSVLVIHDGMRISDDSCVSVLEESSRWTVLPRRSCEDRIEASLWLEQQDHHVLPSVGDDDQRYQRPVGSW